MTETLAFGTVETVLGRLLVAATETGVVSLHFRDTPAARATSWIVTAMARPSLERLCKPFQRLSTRVHRL